MPNSDILSQVDREDKEQLHSLPAQRLIEKLSLLKNRVQSARKRWFWELLQNASDYNESVNVRLTVTDSHVVFQHDGGSFSLRDVLNIISPDSNKRDDKKHSDNIGKFGTGLVSTHILSSILDIEGQCIDDENKTFDFRITLDRGCFENKAALIEQMTKAKEDFKNSLEERTPSSGFNTKFSYALGHSLPSVAPLTPTDIDLEYLYEALPYTLCFMPKVKTVEINDERKARHNKSYTITRNNCNQNQLSFTVTKEANEIIEKFVCFEREGVSSVIKIGDGRICAFPKNLSRLFCGLPLVGTEEIGLPFILNSQLFEPTTEREGVELEPGSNESNRKLFSESINLYRDILDYAAKEKLDKCYHIACMSRKYNGTQASNQQFYNQYINKYKQLLLSHAIVRNTEGEFITFSSVLLPFNDSKTDDKLYENALLLNAKSLPTTDDYKQWFCSTDFTLFPEQKYTFQDLAKGIEQKNSIYSFGRQPNEVIRWLTACAEYLKECDSYIFSKHRLLPNQNGELCDVRNLYADIDLPKELKEIYNTLFAKKGEKVESFLLDKQFNDLQLTNQQYTMAMLAKDIDNELSCQFAENQGDSTSISTPLNNLYSWINGSSHTKEELSLWFHWYYPKRATLIVDMLTETQREQALAIAQSGKMEALSTLAAADLTDEEFSLLVANIKKLPTALNMLNARIDDKSFADSDEGDIGEEIVYKDLLMKYPKTQGFKVVWASKERKEPCYDFEVFKGETLVCYCDAKTTRRGITNADSIPFFMRMSQWNFLEKLDNEIPYFIARVFIKDNGQIRYMRISNVPHSMIVVK